MAKRKAPEPLTTIRFIAAIDAIDRSFSRHDNFRDFIEAVYCALAKRTAQDATTAEGYEARYMAVVRRHAREAQAMARMKALFHAFLQKFAEDPQDFLGKAYMDAEIANARAGQFFTPSPVSQAIAQMLLSKDDLDRLIAEKNVVTVQEPAAGAGGMLLAMAETFRAHGHNPADTMLATAVERDPLCHAMAFIQLACAGVPAICHLGDSLSLEIRETVLTPAAILLLSRRAVPSDAAAE